MSDTSDDSDGSCESTGPITCSRSKTYEPFSSSSDSDEASRKFINEMGKLSMNVEEKNCILQFLDTGEIGKPFVPEKIYTHIKESAPYICKRLNSMVGKDDGWGYLSPCLMKDFNVTYTGRLPKNILCDVCIFMKDEPVYILTFTNRKSRYPNINKYNSALVHTLVSRCKTEGLNLGVIYGVIEKVNCQNEAVFRQRLNDVKSDAIKFSLPGTFDMSTVKFKKVTRIFLGLIPYGPKLEHSMHEVQELTIGPGDIGCYSKENITLDQWIFNGYRRRGSDTSGYLSHDTASVQESESEEVEDAREEKKETFDILLQACQDGKLDKVVKIYNFHKIDVNRKGQNGKTALMAASFKGHIPVFEFLQRNGADVNMLDDDKNTFLHYACVKDNVEFMKYLLSLNIININVRGGWSRTPIMIAAEYGCRKVFDLLKAKGGNVNVVDDDKDTILHVACFSDNVEFVKYLLSLNIADINDRGHWGRTPIMVAAQKGCRKVFDLLLAEGADINMVDDHEDTLLHIACFNDNDEFVKYLLSLHIVDINIGGQWGRTPIMVAAQRGCRKVFDLLMAEGADINVLDNNKTTILHIACFKDNVEFVKYLLSLNIADVNIRGHWGRTPIMVAAQKGCRKVFDLLLAEGADINVVEDNKYTILHVACFKDNDEFLKYLLSLNIADIDVRGQWGRTPIMVAAELGCRKVFDLLLAEGADINVVDDNKNTILHVACFKDNVEFVKYLLSLNIADINVRGRWGRTPLMFAAEYGCRKVFEILNAEGADINLVDDNKNTILHVACFKDNVEFVKYLLSLNIADINVRGHRGRTPLMLAAEYGCRKVFDLLVAEGAYTNILDDFKNSILHVACFKDNVEFFRYLLSLNIADINARAWSGRTVIMVAANYGCRKVFDLLMAEGADINLVDDNKYTILHVACFKDNDEFVKYFLSLNIADINVRGQWGRTPIMVAAQKGYRKVFDLLMAEGADINVVDDNKNTILHVACFNDNVAFVKYLLSLNIADINVIGGWGRTPLMFSAEYGCRKVFEILNAEGADVTVVDDNKNTILHIACFKDYVELVKYLLSLNIADINVRGHRGRTPLMFAAEYGSRKVFDLLVAEGADTNILDDFQNTILHVACFKDNVEFVKYLLSLNIADINVRGWSGRTVIMVAANHGCRNVFDLLLAKGADINVVDDNKYTILHVACFRDNVEFVKYLLSLNLADINARGRRGRTPIMVAAQFCCGKVFDLLVAEGADINVVDDSKSTILHFASVNDNVEFLKYLLSLNFADINIRSKSGRTPIMCAAESGSRKVFDLLIAEGADINVLDDNKDTILHYACVNDSEEFMKHLLSLNIVDINVRGQWGRTPIMVAAQRECKKVFDLLMAEGADINVVDDNKNTILHYACVNDNVEFVKYLLSLNIADINFRGQWGRTPIMVASQKGCIKVFDLLRAEGADVNLLDDMKSSN